MKWKSLIYLASPYTAPTASLRARNYLAARRASKQLMLMGAHVFSPVAHGHSIETAWHGKLVPYHQWIHAGLDMLSRSDLLYVLCLEGWTRSRGIRMEILHAHRKHIPIGFFTPHQFEEMYESAKLLKASRINLRSDQAIVAC